MNFAQEYDARKAKFERALQETVRARFVGYPMPLADAMRYALSTGGKRLRPVLLAEAANLFAPTDMLAVPLFSVATECIHTYSLIHDDLPCMDDDDFRRGKPACHRAYGEANAVLAGDALLNFAYELIFEAAQGDERAFRAGHILARAAGGDGLIGGQVRDLAPDVTAADIDYIYTHKTGALLCAALEAGAVLGGADEKSLRAVHDFGAAFGYAFQLRDDLLDADTDGGNTYLAFAGKAETERALRQKSDVALSALSALPRTEFLRALTENFIYRTK